MTILQMNLNSGTSRRLKNFKGTCKSGGRGIRAMVPGLGPGGRGPGGRGKWFLKAGWREESSTHSPVMGAVLIHFLKSKFFQATVGNSPSYMNFVPNNWLKTYGGPEGSHSLNVNEILKTKCDFSSKLIYMYV